MKSIMETVNEIIAFFLSYTIWAQVGMTACVVVFFVFMIFGKKNSGTQAPGSLAEIVEQSKKRSDFKAKILSERSLLPEYLRDLQRFNDVESIYEIEINQVNFDLLVYLHNKELNQQVHLILLIDFYDPDQSPDWIKLNDKWEIVNASITYPTLKAYLHQAKGFRAPLEFADPFGGDRVYTPRLIYVQVAGKRSDISQQDIATMQQKYFPTDRDSVARITGTYDYLLDGFVPIF